jgi:hypothetical protein
MTYGFLTRENKQTIFDLLEPVIKEKYRLGIDAIPNINKLYSSIARDINKKNSLLDIIGKNKILVREIIQFYKQVYETNEQQKKEIHNHIETTSSEQAPSEQAISEQAISEQAISEQAISEQAISEQAISEPENEVLNEQEINYDDTHIRMEKLKEEREKEIENIMKQRNTDSSNNNENKEEIRQTIVRLDSNMTFQTNSSDFNSVDNVRVKKILFPSIVSSNEICQSAFLNVTIEDKKSIFFNTGIYGGCYRFNSDYDLDVVVKNKLSITVDVRRPSGDVYKQQHVLLYIVY